MHATNKSTEDEYTSRWLVGGVIWIPVVDRIFDEGTCAILLAVSLESCGEASASANIIGEEITIYICFFSYDNVFKVILH